MLLVFLGLITHFAFIFNPLSVVLDEYHFINFTEKYIQQEYFYDIHPPLGKMMLGAWGKIINLPQTSPISPASPFPDSKFALLRILPAFFGILLIIAVWLLAKELTQSRSTAFLAGLIMSLENMTLLQSRLTLMDSMLWFFMFFGLWIFVFSAKRNYPLSLTAVSGVFLGLAGAVKWTGFGALLTAFFWILFADTKRLKIIFIIAASAFLSYFAVFAFNFAIFKLPSQDKLFTLNFTQINPTSRGIEFALPPSSKTTLGKFVEANVYMLTGNFNIPPHPAQSKFWQWPLGSGIFWYYYGQSQKLALLPNLATTWMALGAMVVSLAMFALKKIKWDDQYKESKPVLMLLLGWLINWLPFLFIERPMFIYHYAPALIFGIMLLSALAGYYSKINPAAKKPVFILIIGAAAASFIMQIPTTFLYK